MKTIKKISLTVFLLLLIISCKKDDDNNNGQGHFDIVVDGLTYTGSSVYKSHAGSNAELTLISMADNDFSFGHSTENANFVVGNTVQINFELTVVSIENVPYIGHSGTIYIVNDHRIEIIGLLQDPLGQNTITIDGFAEWNN